MVVWFVEQPDFGVGKFVFFSDFFLRLVNGKKNNGMFGANNNFAGFLRGGVQGGGNWGTLRIPREDWGTLGNIRED